MASETLTVAKIKALLKFDGAEVASCETEREIEALLRFDKAYLMTDKTKQGHFTADIYVLVPHYRVLAVATGRTRLDAVQTAWQQYVTNTTERSPDYNTRFVEGG